MSEPETDDAAEAAAPAGPKATRASERKWGAPVMKLGFCIVPSLLLRAQRRLKLNPTQLAVLLQLCDHWWDSACKPYPSKQTLAERLSLSPRQVQRHIADLEEAGLVQRIERRGSNGGKLTNTYDLSGLVARLQALEPEFTAMEDENRKRRAAVARPGLRARHAASPAPAA
jgi:DNA-binding transcriptional ArsR family regulator